MKPYKQTTFDPTMNLFAFAITDDGVQCSAARCNTIEELRHRIRENFQTGHRTEVAVMSVNQLECVMKRVLKL